MPVKISKNGPAISHLFFADDCLLFTKAKASQVRLVQEVLNSFCLASGMKVNVHKSRFLPSKNIPRTKVAKFEGMTEFQHTFNIGKYLGFPFLSGRVANRDFTYIVDRVNSRLAGWKGRLLSRAGRVTLAKFVLSSMPIYTMQNIWLPEGVCDSVDTCIRQFIWGGKTNHWVKWSTVSRPVSKGGLGIHLAKNANISLLGKHVWDLIHKPEKLWVQLLSEKYLANGHILYTTTCKGASYTWNSIIKAAEVLKQGFITRIGRGDVSIWYDKWLDRGCIAELIPFVNIQDTQLKVKDIFYEGMWHFNTLATQLPTVLKW